MFAEQAVQIKVTGGRLTSLVIREAMHYFLYQHRTGNQQRSAQSSTVHGEQSLKDLNAQNRPLNHVEVNSQDVENIRRELNRYGVDFSVLQEKDGTFQLYFKAQDIDRVHQGMENCVKNFDRTAGRKPMEEQLGSAVREARERNAANEAKRAMEKAAEKAVQKEVTL